MTGAELLPNLIAMQEAGLMIRVDQMEGVSRTYHLRLPPHVTCRELPSPWFLVWRDEPISVALEALLAHEVRRDIRARGLDLSSMIRRDSAEYGTHDLRHPVEPTGIARAEGDSDLAALLDCYITTAQLEGWGA